MMAQESRFDASAKSYKWVKWLCQITWQTIVEIIKQNRRKISKYPQTKDLYITDELLDKAWKIDTSKTLIPINQIKMMISYLSYLEWRFTHIQNKDFKKILIITSYNLGITRTRWLLKQCKEHTWEELKTAIQNEEKVKKNKKIEVIQYVDRVSENMTIFS
jgi:hypothetical protein